MSCALPGTCTTDLLVQVALDERFVLMHNPYSLQLNDLCKFTPHYASLIKLNKSWYCGVMCSQRGVTHSMLFQYLADV